MNRRVRIAVAVVLIAADGFAIKILLNGVPGWRVALGGIFYIGFSCALGVILGRWIGKAER